MRLLAIDWGKSKVGVAIAETIIPEPFGVIKYKTDEELINKLKDIIVSHNIEKIIVGESEGKSKKLSHEFGENLKKELKIDVSYYDETLSSLDAQALSRQAGIKRIKRKEMEDAYAAALILQNYLGDSH